MVNNCRAENPKTCRVHGNNHYKTLNISPGATEHEIKKAYRSEMRKAHPDVGGSKEAFLAVQTAYEILKDPVTKKKYDSEINETSLEKYDYSSYDERFYDLKEQLYEATDAYKLTLASIQQKQQLADQLRAIPSSRPNIAAHLNRIEYVLSGLNHQLFFQKTKMETIFKELKKYHKS